MQKRLILLLFLVLGLAQGANVVAQNYLFQFDDTPLLEAVEDFKSQTGIDVVYSTDLIGEFSSSCTYNGSESLEALRCIVQDAAVEVRVISDRQYVLVLTDLELDESKPSRGTISGFVFDRVSGESLYGANIYLPDLSEGTVTNQAGFFSLPGIPAGRHLVRLSFIGYVAQDTTLTTAPGAIVLELTPTTITLDRVVIERSSLTRADLAVFPGVISI
ncbi:MAG: carboxypeptidase-like regulatory domain-containing protein, partial [Bacteroidetes bacterium]